MKEIVCRHCGKAFEGKGERKYCSHKCCREAQKEFVYRYILEGKGARKDYVFITGAEKEAAPKILDFEG